MSWIQIRQTLKEGKYTSFGCYPKYWLAADGEVLSYEAIKENIRQVVHATKHPGENEQWELVACGINWEDDDLQCSHTSEKIECAYPPQKESKTHHEDNN